MGLDQAWRCEVHRSLQASAFFPREWIFFWRPSRKCPGVIQGETSKATVFYFFALLAHVARRPLLDGVRARHEATPCCKGVSVAVIEAQHCPCRHGRRRRLQGFASKQYVRGPRSPAARIVYHLRASPHVQASGGTENCEARFARRASQGVCNAGPCKGHHGRRGSQHGPCAGVAQPIRACVFTIPDEECLS